MGAVTLPSGGVVYIDTCAMIYGMEGIADYRALMRPLWAAASSRTLEVITSELLVLETLVGPRKSKNQPLLESYEELFRSPDIRICPVSTRVLRLAAELRADTGVKTPDAIHAATGLLESCGHFVTNDAGFKRISALPIVLLSQCL